MTPASSSRLMCSIRPVVTATAACSGLRPVAKAFGCGLSMMKTRGIGRPARSARPRNQIDQVRRGRVIDLLRAVHRQHHPVGIPVAEQIHRGRDDECDHRAGLAADQKADAHEQGRQPRQQNGRPQIVHLTPPQGVRQRNSSMPSDWDGRFGLQGGTPNRRTALSVPEGLSEAHGDDAMEAFMADENPEIREASREAAAVPGCGTRAGRGGAAPGRARPAGHRPAKGIRRAERA